MIDDRIRATLGAYFDAVNRDDFAALAQLFAPDAAVTGPFGGPYEGRDAIRAYYENVLDGWTEHRDEPTRTIVCGTTATVEISFTGAREGGGPAVEFEAVDVFDFDGEGLIATLRNWYDSHHVLALVAAANA